MTQPNNHTHSVWLIDDDPSIRWVLERTLSNAGFIISVFETASSALSRYKRISTTDRPQLILTDIRMPGISGFELLKQIKHLNPKQTIIIMTAYSDLDTTVQGYQHGAFEYLPKPFDIDEAVALVIKACESQQQQHSVDNIRNNADNDMIGDSLVARKLYRQIGKLSALSNNLLISGESGTGKTLIANTIHSEHNKNDYPLTTLAISSTTTVQDITDIINSLKQQAQTTLLIKYIESLTESAQNYLSQVLANAALAQKNRPLRVICTTSAHLFDRVQRGTFSQTLYQQLSETTLGVPALRNRQDDIALLINHYLHQFKYELDQQPIILTADAIAFLSQYEWPGNISQLKNWCRNKCIASETHITLKNLSDELFQTPPTPSLLGEQEITEWEYQLGIWIMRKLAENPDATLPNLQALCEKKLIECALQITKGRKSKAAKLLGWGRNTLTRKLKELD